MRQQRREENVQAIAIVLKSRGKKKLSQSEFKELVNKHRMALSQGFKMEIKKNKLNEIYSNDIKKKQRYYE